MCGVLDHAAKTKVKTQKEEVEQADEALIGGQKKIDANHNGKIDAQDFKILQGQKNKEVKEDTYSDTGYIEHGGYQIPVYQSGDKKMFGHPRKKGEHDGPRFGYGDKEASLYG